MKSLNYGLSVLVVAMSLVGIGCGKSNNAQPAVDLSNPPAAVGAPGITPDAPNGAADPNAATPNVSEPNSANFVPVSISEFNSYVAMHPLNNPTNFKITVSLQDAGNKRFAGLVKLSYLDNGYQYEGKFEAGTGTNQDLFKLRDAGLMEAEFNRWFILNNKYYFSAFFQDAYGAIVLVFDSYVNQGDAQGTGILSGSVYYKNFAQSYAQQSPYRKCWYIYAGAYDCRADAVINKTSPYPGDGYRKLGTFSGLSYSAVFNR